jgi:hypothetical protein
MANWQEAIKQAQASTVEIAGDQPANTLNMALIRLDGGTQPRAEIADYLVADYAGELERGVIFPPVVVFYDGADYWLADGFHRFHAAKKAGYYKIPADIRQGTRRDAVLYSAGANATHGKRRNNSDKRRAVETLLRDEEWGKWSDREIARRCAVSPTFAGEIRAAIRPRLTVRVDSDGPAERRYVNRYGQQSTMKTAAIGKPATPEDWAEFDCARSLAKGLIESSDAPPWVDMPGAVELLNDASYVGPEAMRSALREANAAIDDALKYADRSALAARRAEMAEDDRRRQTLRDAPVIGLLPDEPDSPDSGIDEMIEAFIGLGVRLAASNSLTQDQARRVRDTCEMVLQLTDPPKQGSAK